MFLHPLAKLTLERIEVLNVFLIEKFVYHVRRKKREVIAGRNLLITFLSKLVKTRLAVFVLPDFGHAEAGVDREFCLRPVRDVYFDRQVRGRINVEVYFAFADHTVGVSDVETIIRLRALRRLTPPESGRAD